MKNIYEKPFKPPIETERKKIECETEIYPIVNTQLQQRYDRIATKWGSDIYEGTRRDDLIPELIKTAGIKDGQKILETMCGTALLSKEISRLFPNCSFCALDFSRGMLNVVPDNIKKIQSSVVAMPFADKSFDHIFLRNALYDLPKRLQLKALQEIKRILKNDGSFVLQTYYSIPETKKALNDIVNIKDLASGQYQDMGQECPRYFAEINELTKCFEESSFLFEKVKEFEGFIRYLRTTEMNNLGKSMWLKYIEDLPEEIKHALKLRQEEDGTLTYNFPGVIYKLRLR